MIITTWWRSGWFWKWGSTSSIFLWKSKALSFYKPIVDQQNWCYPIVFHRTSWSTSWIIVCRKIRLKIKILNSIPIISKVKKHVHLSFENMIFLMNKKVGRFWSNTFLKIDLFFPGIYILLLSSHQVVGIVSDFLLKMAKFLPYSKRKVKKSHIFQDHFGNQAQNRD